MLPHSVLCSSRWGALAHHPLWLGNFLLFLNLEEGSQAGEEGPDRRQEG